MARAVTAGVGQLQERRLDRYVIWIVLFLCGFGVVAVYSAITYLATTKGAGDTEMFLFRHVLKMALALGAIVVVSMIDYRAIGRISKLLLVGALALLVIVELLGVSSGGATRWLDLGRFGFQPSDLARVALLVYVAVMLARKQEYIKSFRRAFVPIFLWIIATVVLIGMEDLSTAALVLLTTVVMCFVGRVNILHLGGLGIVAGALAVLLLLSSPNRAARVESFLGIKIFEHTNTEEVFDAQSEGFQAEQARIAFALGGFTGVGPGRSTQRDFLPAPYNDFIFAIIAEEYGLVGAFFLMALFVAILFRGMLRIARRAQDPFGLFLAVGLTTMLVLYGFIHAGVSCGLFPVTGLPMPFVSYGGSNMVASGIMIGLLLSISRHSNDAA
ncbi:MAG: cell division protein FtsW [Bacteroidetes bacterium]|nr:cell division protein FtsW [Bacteroidota bacterium]